MKKKSFILWLVSLFFLTNPTIGQIKEFFITCDPEDFEYIYENYHEDIYVPISLSYEGIVWNDAFVRIRGDGSRQLPKKSLKVKFNSAPFLNGRDRLNFNAEYEDGSYIRSYLSSHIFSMIGQTCFEAEHVRLYLNGDFLGLYLMVENMDQYFLASNGYDHQGNLYKAASEGACMSIYDDIENYWEEKTGSGNKLDLTQFIDEINQVSIADYQNFCGEKMDYDQVVNLIACNLIISNTSTYYHNYYLYHDVNESGLWEMMPWDLDKTFSVNAWRNHTYSSPPWTPDNPFLEKAILNQDMMNDIRNRMDQIFKEVFTPDVLFPIIDSLLSIIEPSVLQDTTDNISGLDEWLFNIDKEKTYINVYPYQLNWYFNHVQSSFISVATPGYQTSNLTFRWSASIDPDGLPVTYRLLLTTGERFQTELTQVFDQIQDTFITVENIEEGRYYWKVIATDQDGQEVDAFDSKNPLDVKDIETLPCIISENTILTKENSPYLVNCNVLVEPQANLIVNEGVTVLFKEDTKLTVKGGLQVNGSKDDPVNFIPSSPHTYFDSLVFEESQLSIDINYLNVKDVVIYCYDADVNINHCNMLLQNKIIDENDNLYMQQFGNVAITNTTVTGNKSGVGIAVKQCQNVLIENCHFDGLKEPLILIKNEHSEVRSNVIKKSDYCGIHISNCNSVILESNQVYWCEQSGIAIGDSSGTNNKPVIIRKNLITNCSFGIEVRDGSFVNMDRTTLYQNNIGVRLHEFTQGIGGGHIDIVNTIIDSSTHAAISRDTHSEYTMSYSICNTEPIEGVGNWYADAGFKSPDVGNFQLISTSHCIDTGDPASTFDPDGTRADMGAFYFNQASYKVIFNEINYKSSTNFDTEDWVELFNADTITAIISGWQFKDENNGHVFDMPFGTKIEPNEYLVLCRNVSMFKGKHPQVENCLGNFDFGLSNQGELIRLINSAGQLIDYVNYGVSAPWPAEPNGSGCTLELINPSLDNKLASSWCSSASHGTPAEVNSCYVNLNESKPVSVVTAKIYPNPVSDNAYLNIQHITGGQLFLQLFASSGRQVLSREETLHGEGETLIVLEPIVTRGVYLLLLQLNSKDANRSSTIKFVVQ